MSYIWISDRVLRVFVLRRTQHSHCKKNKTSPEKQQYKQVEPNAKWQEGRYFFTLCQLTSTIEEVVSLDAWAKIAVFSVKYVASPFSNISPPVK